MEDRDYKERMARLFHDYHGKLHRYAYTMLKDEDLANDIVQRVFIRLWEKRASIVMESAIEGYLYKMTHSQCIDDLRKSKTREEYVQDRARHSEQYADDAKDKLLTTELSDRIHLLLEKLPPQCQLIFRKSRLEGLKYAEIAVELGISIKTVEAQIGKALSIFRAGLADYLVLLLIISKFIHL